MSTTTTGPQTPLEIQEYYSNLLISQYNGLPNSTGTINILAGSAIQAQTSVQTIVFSQAPTSGSFVLSYNSINTVSIAWNASVSTIQSDLQAISGLSSVTVSGSINSLTLTVTFTGVIPPALSLIAVSNSLQATSTPVAITISETDVTLPLAVLNGFNLIPGTTLATGVQLDTIGKYCGVTRSGQGSTGFITLDDADFYQLIQIAIAQNSSGSSLYDIQSFIHRFFPGQIQVFDLSSNPSTVMEMIYLISKSTFSVDLIQLVISEGLLPKPMGVGVTTYFPPTTNLFCFSSATQPVSPIGGGMTTAQSPDLTGHWLQAQDLLV